MISAVIFDLDGVLVDADELHYAALNRALNAFDIDSISKQEHGAIYKGLPTRVKLQIMTERRGLPLSLHGEIAKLKQILTISDLEAAVPVDQQKVDMLARLAKRYKVAVCSNAKRESMKALLKHTGLLSYFHCILSCEDVAQPKPSSEIYLRAMEKLHVNPNETLIIEDSEVGKQAAHASGAYVHHVSDPSGVNYFTVTTAIKQFETPVIVIPAAGLGKRFAEVGYLYPKPLIDVAGRPMIERVLKNIEGLGDPVIILQKQHCMQYAADKLIRQIEPRASIQTVDGLTEGAACTVLLAEQHIDPDRELIIANSDQVVDYDLSLFIDSMRKRKADGGILTFFADHPKWSYAAVGEDGWVSEVAEKKVISAHATVGIYYFRTGRQFLAATRRMIDKNVRVNGEFYVCPVFNELISEGGKVAIHSLDKEKVFGLGTPEDLDTYLGRTTKPHKETEIVILTHRGLEPSSPHFTWKESSLEAFTNHLSRGYGIEFDLQKRGDALIVSHAKDSTSKGVGRLGSLNDVLALIAQKRPKLSALHLKGKYQKTAVLEKLCRVLENYREILQNLLIFDCTPTTAFVLRNAFPEIQLAASVSHLHDKNRYNECVSNTLLDTDTVLKYRSLYDWVWLDEWDTVAEDGGFKIFYTQELFKTLREYRFKIALVSPELHATSPGLLGGEAHVDGESLEGVLARWKQIVALKPDAICTDFPEELRMFITEYDDSYCNA